MGRGLDKWGLEWTRRMGSTLGFDEESMPSMDALLGTDEAGDDWLADLCLHNHMLDVSSARTL